MRVVLPFVDNSSIPDDEATATARVLETVAGTLRASAMELHLETDLAPRQFASLLHLLSPDVFKVTYDTGNSAALGYVPSQEFAAYGNRVGSIHVKDRLPGGPSVPLGTGTTAFAAIRRELAHMSYSGDLILQAARGATGDELEWSVANRNL